MSDVKRKLPTKPMRTSFSCGDDYREAIEAWYIELARRLPGDAVDTLVGLIRSGPLYDGDVVSKSGRDILLELGLCTKIVVSGKAMPEACRAYVKPPPLLAEEEHIKGYSEGYQAATYIGASVYRAMLEVKRVKP